MYRCNKSRSTVVSMWNSSLLYYRSINYYIFPLQTTINLFCPTRHGVKKCSKHTQDQHHETGHLLGSEAKNPIKGEQDVQKLNQELTGRQNRKGIPKFKFKENFTQILCVQQHKNSHHRHLLRTSLSMESARPGCRPSDVTPVLPWENYSVSLRHSFFTSNYGKNPNSDGYILIYRTMSST